MFSQTIVTVSMSTSLAPALRLPSSIFEGQALVNVYRATGLPYCVS